MKRKNLLYSSTEFIHQRSIALTLARACMYIRPTCSCTDESSHRQCSSTAKHGGLNSSRDLDESRGAPVASIFVEVKR